MDFQKQKEQILEYAKKLAEEKLLSEGDSLSVRTGGNVVISKSGADVKSLADKDIEVIKVSDTKDGIHGLHLAIYNEREDIFAVIVNHAEHCLTVAEAGVKIPAVLDDLAQIIGPTVKVAKDGSAEAVLNTLKGRNACIVKKGGVVATGRTLDEAFTGSLVLEKGAKTFIETNVLGGSKPIPYIEAVLQRFVYKKKYSKKDQSAKMEEAK